MAFEEIVDVKGDGKYQIDPQIKAFTLRDLGFTENNAGAYSQTFMLEPDKGFDLSRKLKITFKGDLSAFKISILTANQALNINIFKDEKNKALVEQYRFYIQSLIDRQVIKKI